MAKTQNITDPSLLQDFVITIDQSSIHTDLSKASSESLSQTKQTRLVLLQPLAEAETLAACRGSKSSLFHNSDGSACGPSNHEYLNIEPLSKIWRQALMKVAPIPYLIFDLSLPKEDEKKKGTPQLPKVHWDTSMPSQGRDLGIHAREVMTMVITIATVTRMRFGGNVRFEVTYGENDGASQGAMALLRKQLLVLAKAKVTTVKHGERCTGDDAE